MIGGNGAATPQGFDDSILLFPFSNRIGADELRELYQYWVALRGTRRMPFRHDVDPADIADCLPFVGLLEVERGPMRFRYSFVGAAITNAARQELTGHYLDEVGLGELGRRDMTMMSDVAETGIAAHRAGVFERPRGWLMRQECIAMPLTRDGREVDMILVGQRWEALAKMTKTDRPVT
ncbi:MAG: PAS domain-containing protein [Alphaproteobacteria bacterium]|nr:PAS domain-containing protein [Alphaproteobacteria bacterium]MCZ6764435.1 PAS domain-containing protein [Alphaproteobacteria bacterium]